MVRRSVIRAALVVGVALLALPAVAGAGGFATVGLSSLPDGTAPGKPWHVTLTILQHGRTPMSDRTRPCGSQAPTGRPCARSRPSGPARPGPIRPMSCSRPPGAGSTRSTTASPRRTSTPRSRSAPRPRSRCPARSPAPARRARTARPIATTTAATSRPRSRSRSSPVWPPRSRPPCSCAAARPATPPTGGRAVTGAARRVAIPLLAGVLVAAVAFVVVFVATNGDGGVDSAAPTPAAVAANQPDPTGGRLVFAQMGCGSCHALKAAGSRGQIGPSLDLALKQHSRSSLAAKIQRPGRGRSCPRTSPSG